jgi:hypothetical protein
MPDAVDPYAVERLWQLTQGNVLYLRNIDEYEATHKRLTLRDGTWQWSNQLVVPPSLIETVEARIGDLPPPVADVIDTLAVGEPLELNSLANITSAAAIEEADVRGLIIVEPVEGGMEVRVAHPLYGEVRRNRAASTRLRRLRGAVATELAAGKPDGDARLLVRRAALTLDSGLKPDPDLLVRGAERAIWLGDWLLAERLSARRKPSRWRKMVAPGSQHHWILRWSGSASVTVTSVPWSWQAASRRRSR